MDLIDLQRSLIQGAEAAVFLLGLGGGGGSEALDKGVSVSNNDSLHPNIPKAYKSRSHACFDRLDLGKGWAITHGNNLQDKRNSVPQLFLKTMG